MNSNKTCKEKIELVRCPQDCSNIKLILAKINSFFYEAEQYQYAKEYQFSIISLKNAYEKTFELRKTEEQEYAKFFRLIITESLSNLHQELKRMISGFLRNHNYIGCYLIAEETLELFKKETPVGKLRNLMSNSDSSRMPKTERTAI